MKVTKEGSDLVIRIPFDEKGYQSPSGKSIVHASSKGNKEVDLEVNGKKLVIGLNVYTPAK